MPSNFLLLVLVAFSFPIAKLCAHDLLETIVKLNAAGLQAHAEQRWDIAGANFERALELIQNGETGYQMEAISLRRNVFVIRRDQYRLKEAEQHSRAALHLAEKTLGPSHRLVAHIQNDLGEVLWLQGRPLDAVPYFQRALGITKQTSHPDGEDIVRASSNLAAVLRASGQQRKALDLLGPLVADQKSRGQRTYHTAVAMNNLAMVSVDLGDLEAARELQAEAIEVFGATNSQTDKAVALGNLAQLKVVAGEVKEVETLLDSALKLLTLNGEDSRPRAVPILMLLGEHYFRTARPDRAEPFLSQAAQICSTHYDNGHPDTVATLHLYSQVLKRLGRKKEAKRIAHEARAHERMGPSARHTMSRYVVDISTLLHDGRGADAK